MIGENYMKMIEFHKLETDDFDDCNFMCIQRGYHPYWLVTIDLDGQSDNGNYYIPTEVTSTDEYPPIKEGFPAPPDDSYYTYTQEDYEYLLMIIVGEAQNCSKLHQMYVGSVVLNRLHNDKYFSYGDCIKSIALAPSQYACFSGGGAYRTPTDLNIEVANELIANGSILPANVIFQAEFKQGDGVYAQIGNTYFCYKD